MPTMRIVPTQFAQCRRVKCELHFVHTTSSLPSRARDCTRSVGTQYIQDWVTGYRPSSPRPVDATGFVTERSAHSTS